MTGFPHAGAGVARVGAGLACGLVLLVAAAVSATTAPECAAPAAPSDASAAGERTIPSAYLTLYQQAGHAYTVPWTVLAAIGKIETDHGRSSAPGVHSGVNAFGCCAGPMQFNLRNGPPSTWHAYRVDGDSDGDTDPYNPADAIASAGHYLHALLEQSRGKIAAAVYGYNHSRAYVTDVLARARAYSDTPETALVARTTSNTDAAAACAAGVGAGSTPASLKHAERRSAPRAYATLPAWAMAGGRPAQPVDARLLDNTLWLLRTYRLRVTAAREAGHNTHGDGTALDLVPAEPTDQAAWDHSAGALARDLGWTPDCGTTGTRPACPLAPATQFVGYEGYPGHGSPRTCTGRCHAHLHLSWASPCYGTSALSAPCNWVTGFTTQAAGRAR